MEQLTYRMQHVQGVVSNMIKSVSGDSSSLCQDVSVRMSVMEQLTYRMLHEQPVVSNMIKSVSGDHSVLCLEHLNEITNLLNLYLTYSMWQFIYKTKSTPSECPVLCQYSKLDQLVA